MNARVVEADGARGLPDEAPFDVILLSGSVAEVPQHLLDAAEGRRPAGGDRRPSSRSCARAITRGGDEGFAASSCSTPSRRA